jgi:hypothetical protein
MRLSRPRGELRPKTLRWLATRCWDWAGAFEEATRLVVGRDGLTRRVVGTEEDAVAVLERAIRAQQIKMRDSEIARRMRADRASALQILKILQRDGTLKSRTSKGDNRRHWAIWRMMNLLLERSVYDPSQRCTGACKYRVRSTGHCPAARGGSTRARCAASLVFPYPSKHAAATAVHAGFVQTGFLHPTVTVASVLRQFERHFNNR